MSRTIPTWPTFASVDVEVRAAIEAHGRRFDAYADWAFTTLWSWHHTPRAGVTDLFGNLVARLVDPTSQAPYFSFLGHTRLSETVALLLEAARTLGYQLVLRRVPAVFDPDSSLGQGYQCANEDTSYEYIYSAQELCRLDGRSNRWKRHHLRHLLTRHSASVVPLDPCCETTQRAILRVARIWEAQVTARAKGEVSRRLWICGGIAALRCLLSSAHFLPVRCLGLTEDGQLAGFLIFELSPQGPAIVHFHMADRRVGGAAQLLIWELARTLSCDGCRLINLQEDLGIAGLRLAKTLLRPVALLRKYAITSGDGSESLRLRTAAAAG